MMLSRISRVLCSNRTSRNEITATSFLGSARKVISSSTREVPLVRKRHSSSGELIWVLMRETRVSQ